MKPVHIGVFSDSHGDVRGAVELKKRLPGLDLLLHLGDRVEDAGELAAYFSCPYHVVKGNCDYGASEPREKVVDMAGKRFLLLHGDQCYGELSLLYKAQEQRADAVLFGHSHIPFMEYRQGVLLFNPGSLARPRGGSEAGCGLIIVENGELRACFCSLS